MPRSGQSIGAAMLKLKKMPKKARPRTGLVYGFIFEYESFRQWVHVQPPDRFVDDARNTPVAVAYMWIIHKLFRHWCHVTLEEVRPPKGQPRELEYFCFSIINTNERFPKKPSRRALKAMRKFVQEKLKSQLRMGWAKLIPN